MISFKVTLILAAALAMLAIACGGREPIATEATTESETTSSPSGNLTTPPVTIIPAPTGEPPTASFSVNIESGSAPLLVQFRSTSLGPITSVEWDFGDGTISSGETPSHRYTIAGTYDVELTVSGLGGTDTSFMSGLITIEPGPLVSLEISPEAVTLAVQESVNFVGIARDEFGNVVPSSFEWGTDAAAGSLDDNGGFIAGTEAGSFPETVTVSLQADSGELVASSSITVEPGAVASVAVEPSTVTLDIGATRLFNFKAFDAFANETTDPITAWTVSPDGCGAGATG